MKDIKLKQPGKPTKICKSVKDAKRQMDKSRNATVSNKRTGKTVYVVNTPGRTQK